MNRTWSPQQERIYDWAINGRGSAVIIAVAGAGKTTTIVEMATRISNLPGRLFTTFVAFNKSIAEELKTRLPQSVRAMTLNGMGYSAWLRHLGQGAKVEVDSKKTWNIMRRLLSEDQLERHGAALPKLVALAKGAGLVPFSAGPFDASKYVGLTRDTDEVWQSLIDHYSVDTDDNQLEAIDLARHILRDSIMTGDTVIDFDDQLYLPVICRARFFQNDWLMVDEAQDVNKIQRAMLKRALRPGGRLVAVGDPCQPAGTQVTVKRAGVVSTTNIETVAAGETVMSYVRAGSSFVSRRVKKVSNHSYTGNFYHVACGEKQSTYTSNHWCLVNMKPLADCYCTYVMQRGDNFRVGCCKVGYSQSCGPRSRMLSEGGDACWILATYKTKQEALYEELFLSYKFSLPTVTFTPVNDTGVQLDKKTLDDFWVRVGDNSSGAIDCLNMFYRKLGYPMFNNYEPWETSIRRPTIVRACNLLEGALGLLYKQRTHGGDWLPISILHEFVNGVPVYSLEIEETEMYVADGIATHNCQAIYGFRGADTSSIDNIKKEFGAIELPLTVSYRCPQAVVREAQRFVTHIQATSTAPEGKVASVDKYGHGLFNPTDAILCRNSAPIVDMAFKLIHNQVACRVLGREIGAGLVNLIKKMKAKTLDGLVERLEAHQEREVAKFTAKGEEQKADALVDRMTTIFVFIHNLTEDRRTIPALIERIEALFTDNNKGILTLCTVHKAKGLEWDRVFILDADELMPSKWARQEWQMEQEKNLQYVAVTRAKAELYYINTKRMAA